MLLIENLFPLLVETFTFLLHDIRESHIGHLDLRLSIHVHGNRSHGKNELKSAYWCTDSRRV
jgi:hypothetical protein